VEEAIKELKDKCTTGDDDDDDDDVVPGDVLRLLEQDGFKIIKQLANNI
jgi:hypothetical protein